MNTGAGATTLNGPITGAGSVSTTAGTLILNNSLNARALNTDAGADRVDAAVA